MIDRRPVQVQGQRHRRPVAHGAIGPPAAEGHKGGEPPIERCVPRVDRDDQLVYSAAHGVLGHQAHQPNDHGKGSPQVLVPVGQARHFGKAEPLGSAPGDFTVVDGFHRQAQLPVLHQRHRAIHPVARHGGKHLRGREEVEGGHAHFVGVRHGEAGSHVGLVYEAERAEEFLGPLGDPEVGGCPASLELIQTVVRPALQPGEALVPHAGWRGGRTARPDSGQQGHKGG